MKMFSSVRGTLIAAVLAWATLHLGAVQAIDFYPVFIALALLFMLSLADGIRIEWWGWLLLIPLAPMAVNGSNAFEVMQYIALWLAMVLAAHQMRKDLEEDVRVSPMIYLILALGVVEALMGLAQSLRRFAGQEISFFPMGTIYNRNHFAGFLEMLVPLSLMIGFARLYERSRRRRNRFSARRPTFADRAAKAWIFLLAGGLLFLAILFCLSRGGAVSAMIGTAVAALLFSMREFAPDRSYSRILASSIIILVITGALWIGIQPVVERFVLVPKDSEGRTAVWGGTVQMIRDNPWTGVGAGMHGWAFTSYNTLEGAAFYDYAHNDYLQAAAEWGLPAALIFFGTIIIMIWRAGKACLIAEDPVRASLLAGGVGGIVALLAHSFVDFNLQVPANAILFGIILGLTHSVARAGEVEMFVPGREASGGKG